MLVANLKYNRNEERQGGTNSQLDMARQLINCNKNDE